MSTPLKTGTSAVSPAPSALIRGNAKTAIALGDAGHAKCDFCARVGLPILPLRHAVVPSYVRGVTANPVGWGHVGADIKGQPPEGLKGHRYALRTMRKGYLMVYLGSGLWHAYVVSAGGHLRRLVDIDDPDHKNDREMSEACVRAGHNIPASFITIPPVTRGGTRMIPAKVWIAFSDVLWTARIRKGYERKASAGKGVRGQRFQSFMTDDLGKNADSVVDAFQLNADEAVTTQRLNALVVEYAADDTQSHSRTHYDAVDPYEPKKRNHISWESAHGVSMRTGEAQAVAKFATKLTPSNRDKLMASAVVLDDAVGMVQELNATRLKFVESRQRYLSDPRISRPLLISQSIMGLKALIGEQTFSAVTAEEKKKGQPDVQTETYSFPDDLPSQTQTITVTTTRQERVDAKVGSLWSSLQEHYREADRAAFDKTVIATLKSFQEWLVKTDADYAHWLGQPDWVLRCRDFDSEVAEQQDKLHDVMAACLRGGPTGTPTLNAPTNQAPQDTRVYEVWKKFFQMQPNDEANPIYAALFGFDEGILDYLLPEGPNPLDDKQHKGSKLYKVLKTIIGTKEWTSDTLGGVQQHGASGILTRDAAERVPNPVRAKGAELANAARSSRIAKSTGAIAESMLAMGGALTRMAGGAISEVNEATVMRALQGSVLLYERHEVYLVTSKIRVREYIAYLNNIAFNAAGAGIDALARGVRNAAQMGKNTVRSMAVTGALRIGDKKIRDGFIEVMHWAYADLDGITNAIDALPPQRQAARAAHEVALAVNAAESAAMAAAMRVHPFNLSPGAAQFVEAVTERATAARVGVASVVETMTRSSLRLMSTGSGILAVGSLVMQGWSLKDNIKKASGGYLANNEARVLVVSASVATFGATVELVGVGGKLMGAGWGTLVGRVGGVIGAAASIVEGMQAFMAFSRTSSRGDYDAAGLYLAAGVALAAGGLVGIYGAATGAALLGPIGWALLLIAAGVLLLFFAMKAEDSQAAIWLDRCYWGTGKRFARGRNNVDRPWTNNEIDQELGQLNAIIIGLAGETNFNDDGWGFADVIWDTVKAKVTFPGYDPAVSAYEWRLRAVNPRQHLNITLASGKHLNVPDDPDAIIVRSRAPNRQVLGDREYFRNLVGPTYKLEGDKKNVLVAEVSVEVRVRYFQDVELTVEYVTDVSDPRGRASLALSEKDW